MTTSGVKLPRRYHAIASLAPDHLKYLTPLSFGLIRRDLIPEWSRQWTTIVVETPWGESDGPRTQNQIAIMCVDFRRKIEECKNKGQTRISLDVVFDDDNDSDTDPERSDLVLTRVIAAGLDSMRNGLTALEMRDTGLRRPHVLVLMPIIGTLVHLTELNLCDAGSIWLHTLHTAIPHLQDLRVVNVSGGEFGKSGVRFINSLRELPVLTHLTIGSTDITGFRAADHDVWKVVLPTLSNLRVLDVWPSGQGTGYVGPHWDILASCPPNIEYLDLGFRHVHEADPVRPLWNIDRHTCTLRYLRDLRMSVSPHVVLPRAVPMCDATIATVGYMSNEEARAMESSLRQLTRLQTAIFTDVDGVDTLCALLRCTGSWDHLEDLSITSRCPVVADKDDTSCALGAAFEQMPRLQTMGLHVYGGTTHNDAFIACLTAFPRARGATVLYSSTTITEEMVDPLMGVLASDAAPRVLMVELDDTPNASVVQPIQDRLLDAARRSQRVRVVRLNDTPHVISH